MKKKILRMILSSIYDFFQRYIILILILFVLNEFKINFTAKIQNRNFYQMNILSLLHGNWWWRNFLKAA